MEKYKSFFRVAYLVLGFSLVGGIAQAQTISGVVTDANSDEALQGVNIVVKGTTIGVASGSDGEYVLSVPSLQDTLMFSFVGYHTREIPINGRTTIDISLEVSELISDELVVVGYGTQRRGELTGSIGSISEDDFNQGVTASPGQLMQGKIAGVNITAVSGQPGSSQDVTIRGPGSLRVGSGPLYVVDGVPVSNAPTTPGVADFGPGAPPTTNPLSFLNPSDIESIDVLKDASATAIYGSRGANGVILITTKQGGGESQLNYSGSFTVSQVANKIDMLSAEEFVEFQESIGQGDMDMGSRTNFFDAITRTAYTNRHSLSYGGGTETLNYYASVNYSNQEGIIISNKLKNFGGHLRLNSGFLDNRLNIELNLLANRQRTDYVPVANAASTNLGDMLTNALTQNPTQPIYNDDGSFYEIREEGMNPVQVPEIFTDFGEVTRIIGNLNVNFEIIDGLEYNLSNSIDNSMGNRFSQVSPHNNQRIQAPEGAFRFGNRENSNLQTESTLNYVFSREDHNVDLLLGYSYQVFVNEGRNFAVRDFTTTEIPAYYNPGIGSRVTIDDLPSGSSDKNQLQSFFGRANYDYMNRYFLTATLRADGSSRFGENHRYGYFPSFAAAWDISDESFMSSDALTNLKLRVGWGKSGNQSIPNGITQPRIIVSQGNGYQLNPGQITPGISYVRTQNEDIRWEVSTQTNVGIDFGLFEGSGGAFTGTMDIFRKVTSDILFETTTGVDPISGTSSFWNNYDMEIVNKGIELALDYRQQIGNDLSFNVGGNITFLDNEIRNLPVSQIRTGAINGRGLSGETVQVLKNGLPFGAFWVFDFQGLDENGENIFRDVDGNGSITNADRVSPGSAIPEFNYGFSTNLMYRNWALNLNFNGVYGNKVYWNDHNARFNMPQLYAGNNIAKVGFNPDESPINSATASSRYLHDGSYLRLSNATISYDFNTANIPLRGLQLSVTGQNLFIITDYPGFDPEVDKPRPERGFKSKGIDSSRYPTARSVMFSIGISF